MRNLALILLLALAACGGSKKQADAMASSGPPRHKGIECKGLPEFVVLAPDADVDSCDPGNAKSAHVTGKIVYRTGQSPKAVLAANIDTAHKFGLPDAIADLNSETPMYSANDATGGRSLTVSTELVAVGGTQVTVEFAKENWDVAEPRSSSAPAAAGGVPFQ